MNISPAIYNSSAINYAAIARNEAYAENENNSSASNNYDSVSISKEGLAELRSLLQTAKSAANAQNTGNSGMGTIENRAYAIVMSKAISVYAGMA